MSQFLDDDDCPFGRDSDDEDDNTDYLPESLIDFVAKAKETLKSTQELLQAQFDVGTSARSTGTSPSKSYLSETVMTEEQNGELLITHEPVEDDQDRQLRDELMSRIGRQSLFSPDSDVTIMSSNVTGHATPQVKQQPTIKTDEAQFQVQSFMTPALGTQDSILEESDDDEFATPFDTTEEQPIQSFLSVPIPEPDDYEEDFLARESEPSARYEEVEELIPDHDELPLQEDLCPTSDPALANETNYSYPGHDTPLLQKAPAPPISEPVPPNISVQNSAPIAVDSPKVPSSTNGKHLHATPVSSNTSAALNNSNKKLISLSQLVGGSKKKKPETQKPAPDRKMSFFERLSRPKNPRRKVMPIDTSAQSKTVKQVSPKLKAKIDAMGQRGTPKKTEVPVAASPPVKQVVDGIEQLKVEDEEEELQPVVKNRHKTGGQDVDGRVLDAPKENLSRPIELSNDSVDDDKVQVEKKPESHPSKFESAINAGSTSATSTMPPTLNSEMTLPTAEPPNKNHEDDKMTMPDIQDDHVGSSDNQPISSLGEKIIESDFLPPQNTESDNAFFPNVVHRLTGTSKPLVRKSTQPPPRLSAKVPSSKPTTKTRTLKTSRTSRVSSQPTVTKKPAAIKVRPSTLSHLTRPTESSKIRESLTSPTAKRGASISPAEGIRKAKERLRQHKLAQAKKDAATKRRPLAKEQPKKPNWKALQEQTRERVRLQKLAREKEQKERQKRLRSAPVPSTRRLQKSGTERAAKSLVVKPSSKLPTKTSSWKSRKTVPIAPKLSTLAKYGSKQTQSVKNKKIAKRSLTTAEQLNEFVTKGFRNSDIPISPPRKGPKITKPEPFHFRRESPSNSTNSQRKKVRSLAEKQDDFMHGLRDSKNVFSLKKRDLHKPTIPTSPKFAPLPKRSKAKSTAEKEAEMMNYYKDNPFKAAPILKGNAIHSSSRGVPRVSKKHHTLPIPFKLGPSKISTPSSSNSRSMRDEAEMQKQFKARPLPNFRASKSAPRPRTFSAASNENGGKLGPVSPLASHHSHSPRKRSTTPTPFKLSRNRTSAKAQTSDEIELKKKFKARPLPMSTFVPPKYGTTRNNGKVPSTIAITTMFDPPDSTIASDPEQQLASDENLFFSESQMHHEVDEADFEEMKARALEEAMKHREFHSRPVSEGRTVRHKTPAKPLTKPEPFHLQYDQRHKRYQHEFEDKIGREEKERERMAQVKARPIPKGVLVPRNVEPIKSSKTPVQPISPQLKSAQRSRERKLFDEKAQKERLAQQALQRNIEERLAAAEEAEIYEMRRLPVSEGGLIPVAQKLPKSLLSA